MAAPRALHPAADLRRALHGHFDLDEPEPFRLYSVDFMKDDTGGVPAWNGDPASFEAFATACKWYTLSLKESERRQAASRVWQRLQGAAKSVVRHLDPSEYDATNGLDKLLEALRSSPLQRLPVSDSLERTSRSCSCEKRNFSQSFNSLSNEPGLSESAHPLWELGQLPGNMNHQHPHRGHLLDPLGRLRRTRQLPNIEDPWRLISLVMIFEGTAC